MSTPDVAKPWFINEGVTPNSHNLIRLYRIPQLNNRLGFINPGLTLIISNQQTLAFNHI